MYHEFYDFAIVEKRNLATGHLETKNSPWKPGK